MAAECDYLGHSSSLVTQIGQGSSAKVVESQWAFYARHLRTLPKAFPKNVSIGVWLGLAPRKDAKGN